jgi:hypothetical protein
MREFKEALAWVLTIGTIIGVFSIINFALTSVWRLGILGSIIAVAVTMMAIGCFNDTPTDNNMWAESNDKDKK